jgi:hypothetical protein
MEFASRLLKVLAQDSIQFGFDFWWRVFQVFMRKIDEIYSSRIRVQAEGQHSW